MADGDRFRVVIAGGGVAGLETALALHDLARDLVEMTLLAPEAQFVYRPMSVGEPFAYAPARRYPLSEVADDVGAELVVDWFSWVDPARRLAHTEHGGALGYDAFVLALGARMRAPFAHAITVDDRRMDELLHGIVQDVEEGYVRSVAFLAPGRLAWPLPVYELALMTARRARDMSVRVQITVVTPEEAPLAVFGEPASEAVAALLAEVGVAVETSSEVQVPEPGRIVLKPSDRLLEVDRVVALPELYGPSVRGLPAGDHGFIPVDRHGAVVGVERVYAAGDATEFAVKHGGVAAQQADAVAEAIAALAGAPLEPKPFVPEIRGMLLTGAEPLFLTARLTGTHGARSEVSSEPSWAPSAKIAARYLAPYLERRDRGS